MRVGVNLYANLAKYAPPGSGRYAIPLELDDGDTVAAVLRRLKVPSRERTTVLIEGRHVSLNQCVYEGAQLHVFPPMCGG